MKDLQVLKDSIKKLNKDRINELLENIIKKYDSKEIIDNVFIPMLNELRELCRNNKIALPELLFSMQILLNLLKRLDMKDIEKANVNKKIVIGVIEGDPHDMGKNIVARMYECYGFQVYDIGKDVSVSKFVEKSKEVTADIVGISTMMSTTIDKVREAIKAIKRENPHTKIIVGGSFITSEIALDIGANGYAESAGDLIEKTNAMFLNN